MCLSRIVLRGEYGPPRGETGRIMALLGVKQGGLWPISDCFMENMAHFGLFYENMAHYGSFLEDYGPLWLIP